MREFKETPIGKLPVDWSISTLEDEAEVVTDFSANGSFASLAENVKYKDNFDYAVLIRLTDFKNDFKGKFVYVDKHAYNFLKKSKLFGGEIKVTIGGVVSLIIWIQ